MKSFMQVLREAKDELEKPQISIRDMVYIGQDGKAYNMHDMWMYVHGYTEQHPQELRAN